MYQATAHSVYMSLVPLLPLFHLFNRKYFDGTLVDDGIPMVCVRWSDGRLTKTAGFYRRLRIQKAKTHCEIVLSRPVLEHLPLIATESTLCHEMIHAWIDLVLDQREAHGPNFHARMEAINSCQSRFQVSLRHNFPVSEKPAKWLAICPKCDSSFPYKRKVKGVACRKCCDRFFGGQWSSSCLLSFEPSLK